MIRVIKERFNNDNDKIIVGTHNGIFHCDEVLAVAILSIATKDEINVIRSRDLELLNSNTDILVDIGGGEFDHHQKGGNGERENGVKYASAGLIWRKYGNQVIDLLSNNELDNTETNILSDYIDNGIIQNVDMEDNGQLVTSHPFQFINSFLPNWNTKCDYDEKFEECVNIVKVTLENMIKSNISLYLAKKEIASRLSSEEKHIGNILVLPCQTIPWTDELIDYNENSESKVDFVVFPYPAGGYALQCVPPSKDNKFGQRIKLPKEWAGETTRLPEISGISSAILCHNGRFFARADEYSDIIKMCKIATEVELNKENESKNVKKLVL